MLAQQAHGPRIRPILALADTVSLALAIWLAHLVRFVNHGFNAKWQQLTESPELLAWAAVSFWILSAAAELYESDAVRRFSEAAVRVGVAVVLWSISLALATWVWPDWNFGRGVLILTALVLAPLLLVNRRLLTSMLRRRIRTPALVVGDPEAVREFCGKLATYTSSPWKPVDGSAIPRRAVKDRVEQTGASLIVAAGSHLDESKDVGTELRWLHVSGVPVVGEVDIWAWFEERLPLESLSPELALHPHGFGPVHWDVFHRLIRILDFVQAAVLLIVSLPALLVASLLVLVADGWPVIYRQERMGQFGRPFQILKLRTMRRDAERGGPSFAALKDPRVTMLGRLLRRLRIDELPQLVNVLRGEMALVGPRPERPEFVDELARRIPFYTFRFAVRPGLTGWAQVHTSYARDVEGHRRKLEYDLFYVRQPSLRLYLLTLLRTANAALVGSRSRPPEGAPRKASGRPVARLPASLSAATSPAMVSATQQTLEGLDESR